MFTGRALLNFLYGYPKLKMESQMERLKMYLHVQMFAWRWKKAVHFMSKIVIWIQPQAIQRSYAKVNYDKHFDQIVILQFIVFLFVR